jgi:signal transduction histidine kinase
MLRHRWLFAIATVAVVAFFEAVADKWIDAMFPWPSKLIITTSIISAVAIVLGWLFITAINRLERDLVERNRTLESRNEVLRAVYDVSLAVAGQADPNTTISTIVDHARGLLRADAALLALETPIGQLRLRAVSDTAGALEPTKEGEKPPTEDALDCFLRPGFGIGVTAPVKHSDKRIGTLAVADAGGRLYEIAEIETLSALAIQVGLAIEAARIQDELQELAVQRERERIARDMHDGLAQVLAYVNTKSQAVSQLLLDGRIDDARGQLRQLESAARSVFEDVREAILNLSGTNVPEHGLAQAIEEYAALFAESAALDINFQATPDAATAPLSAATQAEVFSIAREALTNVRKHAHARDVEIDMRRSNGEVVLTIKDDGVGFEADVLARGRERWPHFGLAGMRERAESVGGKVQWHSRPGAGTEVELHVPVGGTTRHQALERSTPLHETQASGPRHQAGRSPHEGGSEAD